VPAAAALEDLVQNRPTTRLRLSPAPGWPGARLPAADQEETPRHGVSALQPVLPLEFCLPSGLPAVPPVPAPVARHAPSGVVPWAARLAQAVLEVVAGERPVLQLMSWVHPDIYRRLERRHHLSRRSRDLRRPANRQADAVRSVHVCHPTEDVAEIAVVTVRADRCVALAMRLERRKGRWFCTELDWA
jgi:hypothetical protein